MAKDWEVPAPGDERALLKHLDRLDGEATDAQHDVRRQMDKSLRLFNSGMPDSTENSIPPLFNANLISPEVRRKAALLSEMKPKLDVRPRKEGLQRTSELLRQVIECNWDEQNAGMVLENLVLMSSVFRSAFCYLGWDAQAAYGLGDIALVALDPRDVLVDPAVRHARDLDTAQYIRVRTVAPLSIAQRLYPDVAKYLKPCGKVLATETERGAGKGSGAVKGGLQEAMKKFGSAGQASGVPRVELFEYYLVDTATDEDDSPEYPNGRVIVRANDDVICADGPNIYYDGRWPFEWLDNCEDLDGPWGRDELDTMRRIQLAFNRLGNTAVKQTLLNAIPFMVIDKNTLDNTAVNVLRDMGYYVAEATAGRRVERQSASVPVQTVIQAMQYLQALLGNLYGTQDSSGNTGTSKGRAEVRSAGMLEGLQQASQVLVRAQARRLESFLERLGQKWVSRIFQFYTVDRLMTFVGSDGQFKSFNFERNQLQSEILKLAAARVTQERQRQAAADADEAEAAGDMPSAITAMRNVTALPVLGKDEILTAIKGAWRDFRFRIEPFSSLAANRVQRGQLLMQLAKEVMLPNRLALKEFGFDDPKSLLKEAVAEQQERQAAGVTPPQPQQKGKKQGAK